MHSWEIVNWASQRASFFNQIDFGDEKFIDLKHDLIKFTRDAFNLASKKEI